MHDGYFARPSMNRSLLLASAVMAANLLLVLLFPPFDYISLQQGNVPTFDGFYFAFGNRPNRTLNIGFLAAELVVITANALIAWLLLRERELGKPRPAGNRLQRGVLWFVALNLLLVLLFPPFQDYRALSGAVLPTFEGFYFIFADNSRRQIVSTVLDIEVILVLVNGCLLWLMLGKQGREKLKASDIRDLAEQLQAARHPPG